MAFANSSGFNSFMLFAFKVLYLFCLRFNYVCSMVQPFCFIIWAALMKFYFELMFLILFSKASADQSTNSIKKRKGWARFNDYVRSFLTNAVYYLQHLGGHGTESGSSKAVASTPMTRLPSFYFYHNNNNNNNNNNIIIIIIIIIIISNKYFLSSLFLIQNFY